MRWSTRLLRPNRAQIWFFLRLSVSIGLLAWLVLGFDWYETWQALKGTSIWGIGALVLGVMLNRLLAFYRFWVLLRSERTAFDLRTVIRLSFLAVFAGNFLPTTVGGDVAKIGWLASKGYPAWRAAIWTLFDRLSNMLAVALLAPFCLLLPFLSAYTARFLGGWTADLKAAILLFAALILATAIFLGLSPDRQGTALASSAPPAAGMLQKAQGIIRKVLARRRTFGILTLISLLSILPNLLSTWLAALDLGMKVGLWGVTAVYVILYFVTLLPVSINGLGLQEVSTVALYVSLGSAEAQAVALAVLLRFAILVTTLPGALWLSRGVEGSNLLRPAAPANLHPGSEAGSNNLPEGGS